MATKPKTVQVAAGLVKATQRASTRKWSFLALFMLIFFITTGVAGALDVLPEPRVATEVENTPVLVASPVAAVSDPEMPMKIEIPSIDLTVAVSNPESTDIAVLDHELLKGVVRYPTSAKLGENGNVIIFGHSSYLPIVSNKSFKAFNEIQDLEKGDRITVTGNDHAYVYAVETVVKASAEDDSIPLVVDGQKLTLATCNSFGDKSDRFVVTAVLVETRPL